MSFFKVDKKATSLVVTSKKLRYVIDDKGKGSWIQPTKPLNDRLPYDYCEDVDC